MIVVDASALTRALTDAKHGRAARAELFRDTAWLAPDHWRVEFLSALRGLVRGRKVPEDVALGFIGRLPTMTVESVPLDRAMVDRIWQLRDRVTAYDAAYVALAELRGCPLVTGDARLTRAGGLRCEIRLVPS